MSCQTLDTRSRLIFDKEILNDYSAFFLYHASLGTCGADQLISYFHRRKGRTKIVLPWEFNGHNLCMWTLWMWRK